MQCPALTSLELLGEWDLLSVRDKVAGFRLVAQGCTPGCQTVPRSEVSAVVWAAQWVFQDPSVEAILFTDSQYAMDQWQLLAKGDIAASSCPDLLQTVTWSPRLELRKVKAHNPAGHDPEASAYLRWTTMGNEVADAAARQARAVELNMVVQLSDGIAESNQYQLDHLLSFSRFLVDINVADIERKDQLEELSPAVEGEEAIRGLVHSYFAEWEDYFLIDYLQPSLPSNTDERLRGQDIEVDYDRQLLQWLSTLRWPVQPQVEEKPPNISYFELLVAFTVYSGKLPPLRISLSDHVRVLEPDSIEGQQIPDGILAMIDRFVARIRALETALGRDLILAGEIMGITRLSHMGVEVRLSGLDARPQVPEVASWAPIVLECSRQFGSSFALKEALRRWNNPPEVFC